MDSQKNIIAYGRFKGAAWFNSLKEGKILIGGAGGIGSWLTFQLARTGTNIVVFDDDTVGNENLAGQMYGLPHLGMLKVDAIVDVVNGLCEETKIHPMAERITEENLVDFAEEIHAADVVCVGFDNLEARRLVFEQWVKNGKTDSLFVDGRLNFEEGEVFCIPSTASDEVLEAYRATYFSPEERVELPCTLKATTHCGVLIASLMTSQIVNWFFNKSKPLINRDVSNFKFHLPISLFLTPTLKQETDAEGADSYRPEVVTESTCN